MIGKRIKRQVVWKRINVGLLIAGVFLIVWYTLLSRIGMEITGEKIVRIPFQKDTLKIPIVWTWRAVVDNVLLFIPFGLATTQLLGVKKRYILIGIVLTLAVEITQYCLHIGVFETEDVICNTLGYLIPWSVCSAMKREKVQKAVMKAKYRFYQLIGELKEMDHKHGIYEKYIKRIFDVICALLAIIVFCWLYVIIAVLVRIKLGSPVLFTQPRPGKDEKIFKLYKFRSMTDERDENGELLPDDIRLTSFGKWLRGTSMDELPEAFNILNGTMSVIGPRPQLVRDMTFMTPEQRRRHTVRPGLSGLAQTRGRNALSWDGKLAADLEYIENVTFLGDMKIIFDTVKQVFFKERGLVDSDVDEVDITDDFGDYLLKAGRVSQEEYDLKMNEAKELLGV